MRSGASRSDWVRGTRDHRCDRPLRARPRRQRAQPAQRRRRHPAGRHRRLHRGLRLGEVVAGLRHAVRRGAASLLRVGGAVRAPAAPAGRRSARPGDHRAAAGGGPAAASRSGHLPLVGRHHHHAVQPAADALLASGRLPRRGRPPSGRGLLAQHRGRRLSALPRPRCRARRHRGAARPGPVAEHPRGRDRRLARCLAGCEPAQHRHRSRHRHRPAVAQAAEEGPRLAALHRRAAVGADRART